MCPSKALEHLTASCQDFCAIILILSIKLRSELSCRGRRRSKVCFIFIQADIPWIDAVCFNNLEVVGPKNSALLHSREYFPRRSSWPRDIDLVCFEDDDHSYELREDSFFRTAGEEKEISTPILWKTSTPREESITGTRVITWTGKMKQIDGTEDTGHEYPTGKRDSCNHCKFSLFCIEQLRKADRQKASISLELRPNAWCDLRCS